MPMTRASMSKQITLGPSKRKKKKVVSRKKTKRVVV